MSQTRSGDAGVTLIEVLVSLAIFAVIGLAGLTVLDTVARTGERTEGRLDRLGEMDLAFLILRRDLAQITRRETRLERDRLQFRRARAEGSIALTYRFEAETLYRDVTLPGQPNVPQILLTGVMDAQWRLLDGSGRWAEDWPPDAGAAEAPRAAELTLEVTRAQAEQPLRVTRVFLLPAGHTQ